MTFCAANPGEHKHNWGIIRIPERTARNLKVAYVHDWLVTWRGGEKVLEALASLYPEAPIYTLFHTPGEMPPSLRSRDIRTPKGLAGLTKVRKLLLPFLPAAIESLPLFEYDLIISTSSCVAKGVLPGPQGRHFCYIHSPMRYIWDQRGEYLESLKWVPGARSLISMISANLRLWDIVSSSRVDRFVANSQFVGQRVKRYYNRESTVIPPPIELERFSWDPNAKSSEYFLAAGAMVAYKRFDLAIRACEALGKRLIIAGSGPMEKQLRAMAGRHTEFVISPDNATMVKLLQGASALLFPGIEDFGMIAVEAMACGTPVISLRGGGALDYVTEGRTGLYFDEPREESLIPVLERFQAKNFSPANLTEMAAGFSREAFLRKIKREISTMLEET
jgi:glycosyltransferase involved in cell wall biosynthesis